MSVRIVLDSLLHYRLFREFILNICSIMKIAKVHFAAKIQTYLNKDI